MRKPLSLTVVCAAMAASPVHAQGVGGHPEIMEISESMESFIDAGEIAGAVTLVADRDEILHLSCVGMADIDTKKTMEPDALFWIASMTKPITGTAVMMMQEAGLLSVDDPVEKYLPEFADLKNEAGEKVTITIRQCLTHSSGLSDVKLEEAGEISTLAELMPLVVAKPLKFPPGSKWQYCQSSINTAARIVEVVSGETYPEFLQKRLFDPLDMRNTSFYPSEEMLLGLAKSYKRNDDGALEKVSIHMLGEKSISDTSRYPLANGGLFSTAADYVKFCQMILNGGELNGRRYLKRESVRQMTTVQSGDLETGFTPGNGWGLGWCVIREPQEVTAALSPGSFGHGGAYGTQVWIDPTKNRIHLLMVQRANFPNSDASDVRRAFHEAVPTQ